MGNYYSNKLSAERLKQCYDLAPPRTRQYLQAEIDFVMTAVQPGFRILELGCGYGRVMRPLSSRAAKVFGIDTSLSSLKMATKYLNGCENCFLIQADAVTPALTGDYFHLVICIQNGISAFQVDRSSLIKSAFNLAQSGGKIFFSSYLPYFWRERLRWFELQAEYGLLGEIDSRATGDGIIVCKDGFRAETVGPDEFTSLTEGLAADIQIVEVDHSSLFCVIEKS